MTNSTAVSFSKRAFEKTSSERQQRVLDEAIKEFAAKGYSGTNINKIAENAGISIGAMYAYFASKKDLFLYIVSQQYAMVNDVLSSIDTNQDFFEIVASLFRITRDNALKHPQLCQIYLNVTTDSLADMSHELTMQFENSVAHFLLAQIEIAKQKGQLRADTEGRVLAFCIDNLLITFQFSFTSTYYKERFKLYMGDTYSDDPDTLISSIVRIIKNQL